MYCLLVLAVLSFGTASEVLVNEDKAMEKNAVEETKMMPEKDLMWKKETKKGERRSEPPAYMFHMLEQFAKEGRSGFVRSILPMKGDDDFLGLYFNVVHETSQELRMLSPSLSIQRSQCNCSYCCSQLSEM